MTKQTKQLLAKPVAQSLQEEVRRKAVSFLEIHHRKPKLVVILVGEDPASLVYTQKKGNVALALGLAHETLALPHTTSPQEVHEHVKALNAHPEVDGILIQRPLPNHFKEEDVLFWITPEKDVDAFHPLNAGKLYLGLPCLRPCTPLGILELLRYYKIELAGKQVCVVGRSTIVGKPMATLFLQAHATVTHCHTQTKNLREHTRAAEILVVAAGKRQLIDESYIKKGAVVIDVGIHRTPEGGLTGDVHYDRVAPNTSAITPVPGGVGPMTIAMLMQNTLTAALMRI